MTTANCLTPRRSWEYSRSSLTHYAGPYGDGGEQEGHKREWMIRDCREYGTYHKPSDGYDLLRWGRAVAHAKTVKELKIAAAEFVADPSHPAEVEALEAEYRRVESEWMATPSFSLREIKARTAMKQARETLEAARAGKAVTDPTPATGSANLAAFGLEILEAAKARVAKSGGGEEDEEIMQLAHKHGLIARVVYDPDKHGEVNSDCEPGNTIWWWRENP